MHTYRLIEDIHNEKATLEDVLRYIEKDVENKFDYISIQYELTYPTNHPFIFHIIDAFPDKPWDWSHCDEDPYNDPRPYWFIEKYIERFEGYVIESISSNPNIKQDIVAKYPRLNWHCNALITIGKFDLDFMEMFMDREWTMEEHEAEWGGLTFDGSEGFEFYKKWLPHFWVHEGFLLKLIKFDEFTFDTIAPYPKGEWDWRDVCLTIMKGEWDWKEVCLTIPKGEWDWKDVCMAICKTK